MFKDIVVPITGTSGDSYALTMAPDLALAHEAHLTFMETASYTQPVVYKRQILDMPLSLAALD